MSEKKLMRMRKGELLQLAREKGLKIEESATKKEIVTLLLPPQKGLDEKSSRRIGRQRMMTKAERRLMKKKKEALIGILEAEGIKVDPKALKADVVGMVAKIKPGAAIPAVEKARKPAREEDAAKPEPAEAIAPENNQVRAAQQRVEEAKFSTEVAQVEPEKTGRTLEGKPPAKMISEERQEKELSVSQEAPGKYGEDRIVTMIRDPYWIYVYWEVTGQSLERLRNALGDSEVILRVYDVTGISFTGENANSYFDIGVGEDADNWYIKVGRPDKAYCVDVGLINAAGEFRTIARSNIATTPPGGMSEEVDEKWMTTTEEFERVYALSGGFEPGESSVGLREMMEKQLRMRLASDVVLEKSW